jgi:hypothetical protein
MAQKGTFLNWVDTATMKTILLTNVSLTVFSVRSITCLAPMNYRKIIQKKTKLLVDNFVLIG